MISSALRRTFASLLATGLITGCAAMETVDRSNINHQAMDLRNPNDIGEPSPNSSLRKIKRAGGGESCPTCAH